MLFRKLVLLGGGLYLTFGLSRWLLAKRLAVVVLLSKSYF